MDAIRTLTQGVLPPAGNRIIPKVESETYMDVLFPDRALHWVDSGTSALALALLHLRGRSPEHSKPEVIIPAYCCPDLVSAALYAGFTPVLADLGADSCHLDPLQITELVTDRTLAVIAINFLGLPPPLEQIRASLKGRSKVALIADCAQWFPEDEASASVNADYLTFSFGRGKAVNLLGGGLLVAPEPVTPPYLPVPASRVKAAIYAAKCEAYNLLLHPLLYQLLDRNPLLNLGETRYHALECVTSMAPWQKDRLSTNFQAYRKHKRSAEAAYRYALDEVNELAPLLRESPQKLLRYPLLMPNEGSRDRLLDELRNAGLGATPLYGDALPELADVPIHTLRATQTERAQHFARRLLTLPVHEGVKREHWVQIIDKVLHHLA